LQAVEQAIGRRSIMRLPGCQAEPDG
jgi:hypothetical protein